MPLLWFAALPSPTDQLLLHRTRKILYPCVTHGANEKTYASAKVMARCGEVDDSRRPFKRTEHQPCAYSSFELPAISVTGLLPVLGMPAGQPLSPYQFPLAYQLSDGLQLLVIKHNRFFIVPGGARSQAARYFGGRASKLSEYFAT